MNIVYGGSFNPITKAHINIVNQILNEFKDSKVIIVPVGDDYKKLELIDFKHRINMLNLVFKDNERVIISNVEQEYKYSGTLSTLNKLSEQFNNLFLLVGSDNIINFDKWINYENLLKKYPLLIVNRNNININENMNKFKHLNISYKIINFNSNISSSKIRSNVIKNKKLLTKEVFKYIKAHKLYGVD